MVKLRQEEFEQLVRYMETQYGINLSQKITLVEGRISSVLEQKGFSKFDDYFAYMMQDRSGEEAKMLVTKLTTNYTYFMREEQHYQYLESQILPELVQTVQDKDLRIWSAGCSSGEEPFTTAMLLDHYFGSHKSAWNTQILATDISPQVLEQAREAIYPEERLKNLPEGWRKRYFKELPGGRVQVCDALRREVIFRSFNLMQKNLPFKRKFHLIFCRNVMIYFEKETRDALVERFYDVLEPGGHLFVGLAETINKTNTRYQYIQPSIYKRPR